jgi:hypothetical protein
MGAEETSEHRAREQAAVAGNSVGAMNAAEHVRRGQGLAERRADRGEHDQMHAQQRQQDARDNGATGQGKAEVGEYLNDHFGAQDPARSNRRDRAFR